MTARQLFTLCALLRLPFRQRPFWANEVTGIPVRVFLQIILVLYFRIPEIAGRRYLCYNGHGPDMSGVQFFDKRLRGLLLRIVHIKDSGAVGGTYIISLAVSRGRIMDLEEKLQQFAVRQLFRIKDDLDTFRMRTVVAVSGIGHIPAGVSHPRFNDPRKCADQLLYTPETTTC